MTFPGNHCQYNPNEFCSKRRNREREKSRKGDERSPQCKACIKCRRTKASLKNKTITDDTIYGPFRIYFIVILLSPAISGRCFSCGQIHDQI